MPRSLILSCPDCGNVREVRDAVRSSVEELGLTVRRAEEASLRIELRDGPVEVGCRCVPEQNCSSRGSRQVNLRQILLLVTAFAVLFAILQHPIQRMLSASDAVKQWAAVPWSLYGWFFQVSEIIDPKQLPKSTLGIILFLINALVAMALPFLAMFLGKCIFMWSWNRVATRTESASDNS